MAGLFASRCRAQWESAGVFLVSGRARVDGGDFLFEGRFAIWGDIAGSRARGDLCGPDGMPVLSWSVDSSRALFYMPREEVAFVHPGGLDAGPFTLPVQDLLFLVRTGFPVALEAWQIAEGASASGGSAEWTFLPGEAGICVSMDPGDLFPSSFVWDGGSASITSSSAHDEYRAWPAAWRVVAGGVTAVVDLASFDDAAEPWPGLWDLAIPPSTSVDTLPPAQPIAPGWVIPVR